MGFSECLGDWPASQRPWVSENASGSRPIEPLDQIVYSVDSVIQLGPIMEQAPWLAHCAMSFADCPSHRLQGVSLAAPKSLQRDACYPTPTIHSSANPCWMQQVCDWQRPLRCRGTSAHRPLPLVFRRCPLHWSEKSSEAPLVVPAMTEPKGRQTRRAQSPARNLALLGSGWRPPSSPRGTPVA